MIWMKRTLIFLLMAGVSAVSLWITPSMVEQASAVREERPAPAKGVGMGDGRETSHAANPANVLLSKEGQEPSVPVPPQEPSVPAQNQEPSVPAQNQEPSVPAPPQESETESNREGGLFLIYTLIVMLSIIALGMAFLHYKTILTMNKHDNILYGAHGMSNIIKADSSRAKMSVSYPDQGSVKSLRDCQSDISALQELMSANRNDFEKLSATVRESFKRFNDFIEATKMAIRRLDTVTSAMTSGPVESAVAPAQESETEGDLREQLLAALEAPDQRIHARLVELVAKAMRDPATEGVGLPTNVDYSTAQSRLAQLEERAPAFSGGDAFSDQAPAGALSLDVLKTAVEAERRLLEATWFDLYDDGDMGKFISLALGENHPHLELVEVVQKLAMLLNNVERLGPLAVEIAKPVLRYEEARGRFLHVRQLRAEPLDMISEAYLDQLKKANLLLGVLRFSDQAREALRLDVPNWAADHFPRLADAFYREYQMAKRRGDAASLEEARTLVDKVLASMGLRVLEIAVGRTLFDDRFHMARSTLSDLSMPDGSIASVIRNGMEKFDGGWVLQRQAEVIVNRI